MVVEFLTGLGCLSPGQGRNSSVEASLWAIDWSIGSVLVWRVAIPGQWQSKQNVEDEARRATHQTCATGLRGADSSHRDIVRSTRPHTIGNVWARGRRVRFNLHTKWREKSYPVQRLKGPQKHFGLVCFDLLTTIQVSPTHEKLTWSSCSCTNPNCCRWRFQRRVSARIICSGAGVNR